MYLIIRSVHRKVWVEAFEQYLPTTEIIGYQAETLAGNILSIGRTRTEALVDGLQELMRQLSCESLGELDRAIHQSHNTMVGQEIYSLDSRDVALDLALGELFRA